MAQTITTIAGFSMHDFDGYARVTQQTGCEA